MTDDDLRLLVQRVRISASRVGPMHSAWNDIMDAEAILGIIDGSLMKIRPREDVEKSLLSYINVSTLI